MRGPWSLARAAERLGGVLDGLQAAHEKGLVHGNLHASKFMKTKDGRTLITGFLLPGEPGIAASSAAADVAMLGILLRRFLTGRPQTDVPQGEPAGVTPEAAKLLARATNPNPTKRFASAGELSQALAAAAARELAKT